MARQFKPGTRSNSNIRRASADGRMSGARFAWVKTALGQMVIMKYMEGEEDSDKELGPTIRLYIPRPGGRPLSYNITALTKDELDAMRAFFQLLFDEADPTVQQRDKVAQDAADEGDDSYVRIYRPVPQFVVRSREAGQHNQGVRYRLEDFSSRVGRDTNLDGGVRGAGDELASDEPEESGTEDDGPETYES